jgi:circadian clock protein KaiC
VTETLRVQRLPTGVGGLDLVTHGGLPERRLTLVSGTPGSGKTILGLQFLVAGIERFDQPGVLVTFEERPEDIRANAASFGWDLGRHEAEGRFCIVDASPELDQDVVEVGGYDLGALLARVGHAVERIGARRVTLDSASTLFAQLSDANAVRAGLLRVGARLRQLDVTAMVTTERAVDDSADGPTGIEEYAADNVILLRNHLDESQRRRSLEILKLRGVSHQRGQYPFAIVPDEGIVVLPLSGVALNQPVSHDRVTSGIPALDHLCGGGFFRDAITLVSGATGTGKTLTSTHFVAGGAAAGERCLIFAFEESQDQLSRNAAGWSMDFAAMRREGLLRIESLYPEQAGLEDHLIAMKRMIEAFQPQRIAVDSLSALERSSTPKGFREFVMGLSTFLKQHQIGGLFTSTTPGLLGGNSITDAHISTLTDTVILLRYVELEGRVNRGLTVLKMRGSMHDKMIRRFEIDERGLHIGEPFEGISGILSGAVEVV